MKKTISILLSFIMAFSCVMPVAALASTLDYEVSFYDENGDQLDSTYLVRRGTCIDESLVPALPKGADGNDYIADEGGKNHSSYSWDVDPYTTVITSNTVFTRVRTVEKHDYNFGKPQFKFKSNDKSGLMAFYECPKCGSVGEVGVEIVGANLTEGVRIRIDGSAIGGDGIAYEGNLDIGELKTLVSLMQRVGVPIPGWVNTVLTVADTVLGVADQIQERTSTCAKQGHLYGETPRYTWNDTHSTCIATFTCTREDCHTNYDGHYKDVSMNVTGPVYTNATCTENGEETYSAHVKFSRGNDLDFEDFYTSYVNVWQKKFGHSFSPRVSNGDATCFADGTYSQTCTRCGTVITKPDTGSKLEHLQGRVIVENEIPATCTSAGSYEAVQNCIYCNTELSRETVNVAKLDHTPLAPVVEDYVEATCTNAGSYKSVVKCAECNAVLSSTAVDVPKKEHNFRYEIENFSPSTCTTGGNYTRYKKCVDCGLIDSTEQISLLPSDHDYERIVTPATCKSEGSIDMVCRVCGFSYQEETIDQVEEHKYVTVSEKAPTCTEKGETVMRCSICGDTISEIKEKINHTWGPGVVTQPTCTTGGYTVYTCTECGKTREGDPIPASEHSYTAVTTSPTCESYGYVTHTCSKCGDVYVDGYRGALGHVRGPETIENKVESTCTVNGSYDIVVKCTRCNKEIEREHHTIRLLPHDIFTEIIEPTCTTEGYTMDKCRTCGYEFRVNIDCIDHKPAKAVKEVTVPVTCTSDGKYDTVVYCSECHTELSREPGVSKCTGHKWNSGEITIQPTTTEKGLKTYTCTACGLTRTEELPVISVEEATPDDKEADSASVNKKIKKPENITTISQINKKWMLIRFDAVEGAQNYRVMYRKAGEKKWNYAWTNCKTEYYLKNLKTGGLYEFMFAAYKKNSKNVWERGAYSKTAFRYYYKQKIKKVKPLKKSVKLVWTKDKNSAGYEISYATKADMSNKKRIVIKNKKTTSYVIKKLKSGKKYYFRVRSLKKFGKKTYDGEFSAQKAVKVK